MQFANIEEAIAEIQEGRIVIIVDDEDRGGRLGRQCGHLAYFKPTRLWTRPSRVKTW